jgi:hypothetical protein
MVAMTAENRARNDRWARRAGFTNYQEFLDSQTDEKFRGYRYWLRRAAENLSAEMGLTIDEAMKEVRKIDSEFHQEYAKAAKAGFTEGNPDSEGRVMHNFLTYLGQRDERDWWGVGDTPDLD